MFAVSEVRISQFLEMQKTKLKIGLKHVKADELNPLYLRFPTPGRHPSWGEGLERYQSWGHLGTFESVGDTIDATGISELKV
jgi:hypothetical protein